MLTIALISQIALAAYVPTATPCTESSPVATPAPAHDKKPVYVISTPVISAPPSYPVVVETYEDEVPSTAAPVTEASEVPVYAYEEDTVEIEAPVEHYYAVPVPSPVYSSQAPIVTPPCTETIIPATSSYTDLPTITVHEVPVYHESAPESPVYHESAPEIPVYHESAPEMPVYHESAPEVPVYHQVPPPQIPVSTLPEFPVPSYHESLPEIPIESPTAESLPEFPTETPCTAELPESTPGIFPIEESLPAFPTPASGLYGDEVIDGPFSSQLPVYSSARSNIASILGLFFIALAL